MKDDADRRVTDASSLVELAQIAGREAAETRRNLLGYPGSLPRTGVWVCPSCNETVTHEREMGYYYPPYPDCKCIRAAHEDAYNAFRKAHRQEAVEGEWGKAGVPQRYLNQSLDTFRERPGAPDAIRICRAYVDRFRAGETHDGLIFLGPVGSGKTHLAVGVARALVEKELVPVYFTPAISLLTDLKATFDRINGAGERGRNPVERAKKSPVLILDDFAQESPSDFDRNVLYDVINARYNALMPTIITSNCGDLQLEQRLGKAITSRLYTLCQPVNLRASDYRKETAGAPRQGSDADDSR